eukprot:TRINITY_DN10141_c0_g1_i1.p1 TRINITY_DN10141_c0_g1~~TRINITY_DN10141_c0_g1_i1.p1  ORF type:complete len:309 (+),score=54.60 TRINITY_DN10141_c0_g1_i1:144-1070(+)
MTNKVTVLDGSMGTALRLRVPDIKNDPIWSARLLIQKAGREEVVKLHCEYAEAGAEIITTNNYSVVPEYLNRCDEHPGLDKLTELAVEAAKEGIERSGKSAKIALSLPPLRQSYLPEAPSEDEALQVYNQIIRSSGPGVDYLLAETVSIGDAVKVPSIIAQKESRPLFISYTVAEDGSGNLRSGQSVDEALSQLDHLPQALLFNCSTPDSVTAALKKGLAGKFADSIPAFGGYANSFAPIPVGWNHHKHGPPSDSDVKVDLYTNTVSEWLDMTLATPSKPSLIAGGCCGILPQHIKSISDMVAQRVTA